MLAKLPQCPYVYVEFSLLSHALEKLLRASRFVSDQATISHKYTWVYLLALVASVRVEMGDVSGESPVMNTMLNDIVVLVVHNRVEE